MIKSIGIIGGGKMGTDIFNFLAEFTFKICWVHKDASAREKAETKWIKRLQRLIKTNPGSENSVGELNDRVHITSDLKMLSKCDLILETITEDAELKRKLFADLAGIVKRTTIMATNTSSIPVASLVPAGLWSEKFIGIHFFYPLKLKNLAEVNILNTTDSETIETIKDFLTMTGKFHIFLVEPNHFLFNRLFLKLQAGVYRLHFEQGIAIEELDRLIRENLFPTGIFEFFDKVGIDVIYTSVNNYIRNEPDRDFYQPLIDGLKLLIDGYNSGERDGKGFYSKTVNQAVDQLSAPEKIREEEERKILQKIYCWYIQPWIDACNNNLLTGKQAEFISREYMGLQKGPLELAKEIGFVGKNMKQ